MKLLALLATSSLLAACGSQSVRPEGAAVIIRESHFHTRYCGHYKFHDQWFFLAQHRHGVDCDHELMDGEWLLMDE